MTLRPVLLVKLNIVCPYGQAIWQSLKDLLLPPEKSKLIIFLLNSVFIPPTHIPYMLTLISKAQVYNLEHLCAEKWAG